MERPNLRAGVVQDLDVGTESMVHGIGRAVISVGQVPQQIQHLTYIGGRQSLSKHTPVMVETLTAMTPSLSSSARWRMNSSSSSHCFLLAPTQLLWRHSLLCTSHTPLYVQLAQISPGNSRTSGPTVQERSPTPASPEGHGCS